MKEFGVRYTGTVWGRVPGLRPDNLCVIPIDWTECPQDRRDISTGQTGHVHEMVAVKKWGCPAEFLLVYWLFFHTSRFL